MAPGASMPPFCALKIGAVSVWCDANFRGGVRTKICPLFDMRDCGDPNRGRAWWARRGITESFVSLNVERYFLSRVRTENCPLF